MKVRDKSYMMWVIAAVIVTLLAVVALSGCSRGTRTTSTAPPAPSKPAPPPKPSAAAAAYKVSMTSNNQFVPRDIMAPAGATVTWNNKDTAKPHTVAADISGGPNSDAMFPNGLQPGQSYSWTVPSSAAKGTKYYYHCRFHGKAGKGKTFGQGMSGVVTVQ